MGTVLELRPRVAHDWTLFERSQLETLLDRLPAPIACDLAFGVTDAGDPWCAVLDPDGDVVLHIARIGGRFFVHAMGENIVSEAPDLPAAVARFSGDDLALRRPAIVAQLLPSGAQPLPAHVFGALGEAQVLPIGARPPEAAQAATTMDMAGVPDTAAVRDLPASEMSADHFAWDALSLDLTAFSAPAANPAEPFVSDSPRTSLMVDQTISTESVSGLPVSAPEMILPSARPEAVAAAPAAPFAVAANDADGPGTDTRTTGPDPLSPQGGGSDFTHGFGGSPPSRPEADNDMGLFDLTGQGGAFRAATQEEQIEQTSTLFFVDFESPGVATQYWPPVGPLVGLLNYAETI